MGSGLKLMMNFKMAFLEFRLIKNHSLFVTPCLKKSQKYFTPFKNVKYYNTKDSQKIENGEKEEEKIEKGEKTEKGGNTDSSEEINVIFVNQDNKEHIVKAKVGDSILKVAHENNINIEGACDGFCACSTCHVIIDEKFYDLIPEPLENELDMLEMAPCITETSRLGCQIKLEKKLSGMKVKLPPMTRNFYVDGYVPSPH